MKRFRNWLSSLRWPIRWAVLLVIFVVLLVGAVTVSATTWEYTNSPEFCGTVCHTMPPEYTAYQVSPHARVPCVDCHLGQDSFVMTVPRKAREVTHVINALTQAYEPPIYVKNLRPARDTCEQCHNPDKFSSDTFVEIERYAEDKENSETRIFLVVKTGGGTRRAGLGRGIHWHIENEVWFYSDDRLKQTIPYIKEIGPTGETFEYFDVEAGLPEDFGQQVQDQLHRMDCIDCHNRVSHLFRSPSRAMDDALARNQIDQDIPYIKTKGVELLQANYENTEAGLRAIDSLEAWYRDNHPEYYQANQEAVKKAVAEIKNLFTVTVFPNMGIGWETHPNNSGHKLFPGCFRCHDGKHTTPAGQTIRLECNICHSIPEVIKSEEETPLISVDKPDEPDSHLDSNWLARHRYEFDASCAECHDVTNPGGTDNSSFCSNSACHATEWEFVGLDAPGIREIVEPPPMPGSGQPEPIPHPMGANTDCAICHAPNAVHPFPKDHVNYDQSICTQCHEPTLVETDLELEPATAPDIPHAIEGQADQCEDCHRLEGISPYPENHQAWDSDSCLYCHEKPSATTEADDDERDEDEDEDEGDEEDEAESQWPPIPHPVEGREDCLMCHSLDSIKPFPPDHEGRTADQCQMCHQPES